MFKELEKLKSEALKQLSKISSLADWEKLEAEIFSRQNGSLTALMKAIKEVKPEEKKEHPRSGGFKPEDVSVDKFFNFSGTR